jgi:hypothetical protein
MIVLDMPREPYSMKLPNGVGVKVKPLTTAIYEAAHVKARRAVLEILQNKKDIEDVGGTVEGLPNLEDPDEAQGYSQLIFAQALAESAIISWDGVLMPDRQTPAPVTTETVRDLMMVHAMAEAFVISYTATHERMISEGNASGLSLNGTSRPARARPIAKGARTPGKRARKVG